MTKRKKAAAKKPAARATPKTASKSGRKPGSTSGAKPTAKGASKPAAKKSPSKSGAKPAAKSAAKKQSASKAGPKKPAPAKRSKPASPKATGKPGRPGATKSPTKRAARARAPEMASNGASLAPAASSAPAPPPGRISAQELAIELARLASDDKCTDIVVLDVRSLSPISDFVVVASGTSDRQMRAVADHAEELGTQLGHQAFRSSKDPRALWLLIDFSDVVIHIFEPNTRAHYDIEMMWGDAKRVSWERGSSQSVKSALRSRRTPTPA